VWRVIIRQYTRNSNQKLHTYILAAPSKLIRWFFRPLKRLPGKSPLDPVDALCKRYYKLKLADIISSCVRDWIESFRTFVSPRFGIFSGVAAEAS